MPIEFSPQEAKRLLALNPQLKYLLEPEEDTSVEQTAELVSIYRELDIAWLRLAAAYEANTKAREAVEEAKRGRPLVTPIQVVGAIVFLALLLFVIRGG